MVAPEKMEAWKVEDMYMNADDYFVAFDLKESTSAFQGPGHMIEKPDGKEVDCYPTAHDFCNGTYRPRISDLMQVFHQMGHVQYFQQYQHLPLSQRNSPHPAIHDAIGESVALGALSPGQLKHMGLMQYERYQNNNKIQINYLMMMALAKIPVLPVALALGKWKEDVGSMKKDEWNSHWWKLLGKYQRVKHPVGIGRSKDDLDAIARYDMTGKPYDFEKGAMKVGSTKSYFEVVAYLTNYSTAIRADALLEYFKPLHEFLKKDNKLEERKKKEVNFSFWDIILIGIPMTYWVIFGGGCVFSVICLACLVTHNAPQPVQPAIPPIDPNVTDADVPEMPQFELYELPPGPSHGDPKSPVPSEKKPSGSSSTPTAKSHSGDITINITPPTPERSLTVTPSPTDLPADPNSNYKHARILIGKMYLLHWLLVVCLGVVAAASLSSAREDVEQAWIDFKASKRLPATHGRQYRNLREEVVRKQIFTQNFDKVAAHNKLYEDGAVSYALKISEFSDWTRDEKSTLNGYKKSKAQVADIDVTEFVPAKNAQIPDEIDWRKLGAVTPVKNQGHCGSCWAFSATGALEGQHYVKTGKLISISEQNLVDCSSDHNNMGCYGGDMNPAFTYVHNQDSIDSETAYPYEAENGRCRYEASGNVTTTRGYATIENGNEEYLKAAVATIGPIAVAIDASQDDFSFYSEGVYYNPDCIPGRNDPENELDHGVLVVGYGTEDGQDYWLIKNSWGTKWGDNGYIKMARNRDNNCGVAASASFPLNY
ncbi:hypothetical protein NQ315_016806 [Exocentrus adspersus]|uniref:Cathepsin L n=1 Tax=Exocentrus adspersus TaxID=1586481 RepID=A0AAV8VXH0_9CUCU|nr:hypothetical protein NQ315_016806 [Exocentrus adspersus]